MIENAEQTSEVDIKTENIEDDNEILKVKHKMQDENNSFLTMLKKGKSADYYMNLLNVKTAKVIAVILVVLFGGVYHGALHLLYGVTPCKGLLKDGIYKAGSTAFDFRGDFNQGTGLWQPWGCMMHKYTIM